MDEGARRSASAARGRGRCTRMTVFPETESRGTQRREMPRSGRTSVLRAGYGLEQSHHKRGLARWRNGRWVDRQLQMPQNFLGLNMDSGELRE